MDKIYCPSISLLTQLIRLFFQNTFNKLLTAFITKIEKIIPSSLITAIPRIGAIIVKESKHSSRGESLEFE